MRKFRLSGGIKVAGCLLAIVLLLSFSERKMAATDTALAGIHVLMTNNENNHYLDESDVVNTVNQVFEDKGTGVNLKIVEATLMEIPYLEKAEVYRDLKNNLMVNVKLRRPLARMVTKSKAHSYISYDGHILPVSSRFTSRVPLISGKYAESFNRKDMLSEEADQQVFDLINRINEHEFFKVQLTQLEIDNNLNIKMYPQVTKQVIEFGKPVGIEEKFQKLMIFYRQILPGKGWNSYSRVNVNFEGQIVAE